MEVEKQLTENIARIKLIESLIKQHIAAIDAGGPRLKATAMIRTHTETLQKLRAENNAMLFGELNW